MNVLVACEESQAVCIEMRRLGHRAFSCDIQDCSGGHPEWHIKGDVLPILNGNCEYDTADGTHHVQTGRWDLIIAHPPCTDLAVSGARHFARKRADGRQEDAIKLFCAFLNADCERIAVENPVGIISGEYVRKWFPQLALEYGLPKKPTQIIQPYMFGDPHRKTTCLWLKGLPELIPTNVVSPTLVSYICKNGKKVTFDEYMVRKFEGDRAKHRSKTFPGIARAMAEQWAGSAQHDKGETDEAHN